MGLPGVKKPYTYYRDLIGVMAPRITGVFGPPCACIMFIVCVVSRQKLLFFTDHYTWWWGVLVFVGSVECGGELKKLPFFVCLFALGTACFPWPILKGQAIS